MGIITANGFFQLSRPAKTIGESHNKSVGKFKLKSGAKETKTETEPTSQSGDYLTTSLTNHSSRIRNRNLKYEFSLSDNGGRVDPNQRSIKSFLTVLGAGCADK